MGQLPETCPSGDVVLRESAPEIISPDLRTPDQTGFGIGDLRMEDGVPTVNLLLTGTPSGTAPGLHVGDRFAWGRVEWEVHGICKNKVTLSVVRTPPIPEPSTG